MLFNSLEFFVFLPIFFYLYWFVFNKKLSQQNTLLLIFSYFFYGYWDPRFLSLIFLSTLWDFFLGIEIHKSSSLKLRKRLLFLSIFLNLSLLGFFKYFNFFIENAQSLLLSLGFQVENTWTLNIILPVGISFYTFQTMSYTIDIYRGKLNPTKNFISFACFVSFFPQLIAGPIERAKNLLPQFNKERKFTFNNGLIGMKLILWGLFKKVLIADSLAPSVDVIFNNSEFYHGGILWLGAIFFALQIYCDFSGYSDVAIGAAKLLGFNLMINFRTPYFSRNIGEFWRRWHISLSTWFRDYIYIPLGGSKVSKLLALRNIFIIFLVSGSWHGANWTFIFWGLFHALLFVPSFLFNKNRNYLEVINEKTSFIIKIKEVFFMTKTFLLVTIGWVFFRSNTLNESFIYLHKMFFEFKIPDAFYTKGLIILIFLLIEWNFRGDELLEKTNYKPFVYITAALIIISNLNSNLNFIYFQF